MLPSLLMDMFPYVDLTLAGTEERATLGFGKGFSVISGTCFYVLDASGYTWPDTMPIWDKGSV